MSGLTVAFVATLLITPSPAQQPPRDPARPGPAPSVAGVARDPAAAEADLVAKIAANPTTLPLYYYLAGLQEGRGAFNEAEATLLRAREIDPSNRNTSIALASFYHQRGQFEQAIAVLEALSQRDPANPEPFRMIASFYSVKVSKEQALVPSQQLTYISEGLSAADRALALDADHAQTLIVKTMLLQHRASLETDPVQKQQLVAEAAALRNRANQLNDRRTPGQAASSASLSQSMGPAGVAGGMAPVRVGGHIKAPTKIRDVPPVYPPVAQSARVSGVIILEVTIAVDGRVSDAKVLRSIPLLDEAALDAVRQWEFTPTYLNGVPVPVIMTATVNFTLQ